MSDMLSIILDTETSIHNHIGNNRASPWSDKNEVVWLGFEGIEHNLDGTECTCKYKPTVLNSMLTFYYVLYHLNVGSSGKSLVIVGQNLKFDLGYLIRDTLFRQALFSGKIKVWDIQLAEAMLEGYKQRFPSLDYMARGRGLPIKDSKMKEYWNNGVSTEDIPKEEIIPYLKTDVTNTSEIYFDQLKTLAKPENEKLLINLHLQQEALVTTLLMEYNGMHFDKDIAEEEAADIRLTIHGREDVLSAMMESRGMYKPNPLSPKQVGIYLYGGEQSYAKKEPMLDANGDVVKYKSGKNKGNIRHTNNKYQVKLLPLVSSNKYGTSTGDKTLKDIMKMHPKYEPFCSNLIKLRKEKKELSTYYEGYAAHVWPDNKIRTTFNHTATPTGRLSSTNPNIQNVTREDT